MKSQDLLQQAKQELKNCSPQAYQESLWILSDILKLSSSDTCFKTVTDKEKQQFFQAIKRRKQQEPLEYILKQKIFFNETFYIEPGVFIPREDTELLVQWVLKNIKNQNMLAIDLGAGSGTLCLTLLKAFSKSTWIAVETSSKAILCLKKNYQNLCVKKNLHILQKNVCHIKKSDILNFTKKPVFLILANPPYISSQDHKIAKDVYLFEPPLALFSDQEGLGHIYSWFNKSMELLSASGIYIFEFGWNQEQKVRHFLNQQKILKSYKIYKDKQKIARMAVCIKK